jgi:hypothetical protein
MSRTYKQQINQLGKFLLKFYNREIGYDSETGEGFSESAVEMAIRLLSCRKKEHRIYRVIGMSDKCPCFKGKHDGNL